MSSLTTCIATSIFSLLLIGGFYYLIIKWTKFHIFRFGKALKLIYALVLFGAITISLFATYYNFNDYWENDIVRVVTEFQGVQLGWPKAEVYFRKGKPQYEEKDSDAQVLIYDNTIITISNDRVESIYYDCNGKDSNQWEKVGGVSCFSPVERVLSLYGESKALSVSEDKLNRLYNYPQFNISFELSKSKVDTLRVFDNKKFSHGYHYLPLEKPKLEEKSDTEGKTLEENQPPINETIAAVEKSKNEPDHCAPNISKAERLRRLALRGTVRETGLNTYTTGNYEVVFISGTELFSCK